MGLENLCEVHQPLQLNDFSLFRILQLGTELGSLSSHGWAQNRDRGRELDAAHKYDIIDSER